MVNIIDMNILYRYMKQLYFAQLQMKKCPFFRIHGNSNLFYINLIWLNIQTFDVCII